MVRKSYILWVGYPVIRIRVRLHAHRGKLVDFAVQLEFISGKKWQAVVRYNYAHGYPHQDIVFTEGRRVKKHLSGVVQDIVQYAIKDLRRNWRSYLEEGGYS